MATRGAWGSNAGFILAAVGSAVGLGNLWGFPYKLYTYGGGAFLIPYFVAMLVMGVPLLIMEFAVGHWAQAAAPGAFGRVMSRYRFVGWWLVALAFVIITYYADKSFSFEMKTAPASFFLKKAAGLKPAPEADRRTWLRRVTFDLIGLLRDFMGWLVVVCETHGLDGVYFVASHYHIAMQSRRLVRPLLSRAGLSPPFPIIGYPR